jgi:uncharacterized protein YukE
VATYIIDIPGVLAVRQGVLSSGNRIDGELDTLYSSLQSFLNEWEGGDRDAYDAYRIKWDGLIRDMNQDILPRAAKALDDMVQNIQNTEKSNTNMWA